MRYFASSLTSSSYAWSSSLSGCYWRGVSLAESESPIPFSHMWIIVDIYLL